MYFGYFIDNHENSLNLLNKKCIPNWFMNYHKSQYYVLSRLFGDIHYNIDFKELKNQGWFNVLK